MLQSWGFMKGCCKRSPCACLTLVMKIKRLDATLSIQSKNKIKTNIKGRSWSFTTFNMIDMRPMVICLLSVIHTETNAIAYKFSGLVKHLSIKVVNLRVLDKSNLFNLLFCFSFSRFYATHRAFFPTYLTFQTIPFLCNTNISCPNFERTSEFGRMWRRTYKIWKLCFHLV